MGYVCEDANHAHSRDTCTGPLRWDGKDNPPLQIVGNGRHNGPPDSDWVKTTKLNKPDQKLNELTAPGASKGRAISVLWQKVQQGDDRALVLAVMFLWCLITLAVFGTYALFRYGL